MPAKRTYNDDEDTSSNTSTDSSSEDTPTTTGAGGRAVANKPHDLEYAVDDAQHRETPPRGARGTADAPTRAPAPTAAPAARGSAMLQNNPNDEEHDVNDDGPRIPTPGARGSAAQGRPSGGAPPKTNVPAVGTLQNQPHDAFEDAPDGIETATPRALVSGPTRVGLGAQPAKETLAGGAVGGAAVVRNRPHDEAHEVGSDSSGASPPRAIPQKIAAMTAPSKAPAKAAVPQSAMAAPEDSSEEEDAAEAGKMKANPYEYNPEEYAHINARVSREVQELFSHITAYQPSVQELPSKLRPFIPDFVPCVGDIDTFCKVPRPDGKPDNLGLIVVDEPCAKQSNPTVVKIGLQYVVKQTSTNFLFVDSLEDAANRPQAIDHWVADIKQLHYKKPLPTVSYSKPMPDIETLLQAWPQEFEELLASDVQMPPPTIDLDIDQYVRVLCAILDVPCYANLVESLHVMFTLYLEFRQNQHFQHA